MALACGQHALYGTGFLHVWLMELAETINRRNAYFGNGHHACIWDLDWFELLSAGLAE